jgi:hypothetical protein
MFAESPTEYPPKERDKTFRWTYWTRKKKEVGKWNVNRVASSKRISASEWIEFEPAAASGKWLSHDWGAGDESYFLRVRLADVENASLKKAIAASRSLLVLKPDWDGEGSPGYTENTWQRMERFLIDHSAYLQKTYGVDAPIPEIHPGPDGSIDLLWKSNSYELLVNIPTNPDSPASFYGDDKGSLSIKGKLHPSKFNQGLLQWLMTNQSP